VLCIGDHTIPITQPDITPVATHSCKNLSEQKVGHHCPFSSNIHILWPTCTTSLWPKLYIP